MGNMVEERNLLSSLPTFFNEKRHPELFKNETTYLFLKIQVKH